MRGRSYNFADFRKGIASEGDYLLNPEFLRDALNVVPTETGSVKTRPGAATISSVASGSVVDDGMGAITFGPGSGSLGVSGFIVWVIGTVMRAYNMDTASTFVITPASIAAGRHSMVQAVSSGSEGPLYGHNGDAAATPWSWDGVAGTAFPWTASAGTRPRGKYHLYHTDRMWVAGVLGNESRVYWSGVGDPRQWSSTPPNDAGSVDLEPEDGDQITGLGSIGPYVLVFKRRKMYLLTEPALATGANRKISDQVGCLCHQTIATSPYGTIFLAHDGVKVTDGQQVRHVSSRLDELFRYLPPGPDDAGAMTGIYFKDHYYLSGPATNLPPILDWNIKHDAWWPHGIGANGTVGVRELVNAGGVLLGSGDGAVDNNYRGLYRLFNYEDVAANPLGDENESTGATITPPWRVESGWHTFKQPNINKRIREVRLDFDGNPPVVDMAFAPSTAREVLDSITWESQVAGSPSEYRYFTPGWGRAVSLRVSGTFGVQQELFGYTLSADMRAD